MDRPAGTGAVYSGTDDADLARAADATPHLPYSLSRGTRIHIGMADVDRGCLRAQPPRPAGLRNGVVGARPGVWCGGCRAVCKQSLHRGPALVAVMAAPHQDVGGQGIRNPDWPAAAQLGLLRAGLDAPYGRTAQARRRAVPVPRSAPHARRVAVAGGVPASSTPYSSRAGSWRWERRRETRGVDATSRAVPTSVPTHSTRSSGQRPSCGSHCGKPRQECRSCQRQRPGRARLRPPTLPAQSTRSC